MAWPLAPALPSPRLYTLTCQAWEPESAGCCTPTSRSHMGSAVPLHRCRTLSTQTHMDTHTDTHTYSGARPGPPACGAPESVPTLGSEPLPSLARRKPTKGLTRTHKSQAPQYNGLGFLVTTQVGLRLQKGQRVAISPTHLVRRCWATHSPALYHGSSHSRDIVDYSPALLTFTKTQNTIGRPQTARRGQEQRGCKAGLNSSGEKYIDIFSCCQI
jgi:hypothetical protein